MIKEIKKQFPVIPYSFRIVIYDDPLLLPEKYPHIRFQIDSRDFQGGAFEVDDRGYLCLLSDKNLNHGHIAHECKHLVNLAFRFVGIELDIKNDEAECYFLTWVINEVYKHITVK